MSIRQYYKTRTVLNNQVFPVLPNGCTINWSKNHSVPLFAGNFWQVNYIEGLQTPSIDLNCALLDGNLSTCPLSDAFLGLFLDRSNDYSHDVSSLGTSSFVDGTLLLEFPAVKANSFMVSGSKGDDVSFSSNYMIFAPSPETIPSIAVDDAPAHDLANYSVFEGNPIRFQSLNFIKNGNVALDNVVSFSFNFSNQLTADLSMRGSTASAPDLVLATSGYDPLSAVYQSPLPIDYNAGQQVASARFVFQTQHADNLVTGDSVDIIIEQGAVSITFHLSCLVIDTQYTTGVGSGRQMRTLTATVTGIDNTTPPISVSGN